MLAGSLLGCFGSDGDGIRPAEIHVSHSYGEGESIEVALGQVATFEVEANRDWTVQRSMGFFIQDENQVNRDANNWTFSPVHTELRIFILGTELPGAVLNIAILGEGGEEDVLVNWSVNMTFANLGLGVVDGLRAFDTIDLLTTDYNNRWCASASIHEGGASYLYAAEAMADAMWEMGFDHVEVTDYADDPDQRNVVGYNYGRLYPDEWIIVGGHFDVGYAFTPPGGGTSEGANDDTSGSTVSLEMAQALAQMEFDHTVVSALWACEEEGLLGSSAFSTHLPEGVTVKAYMNFDMVSLNYPIVPPSGYGPYDLSIAVAGATDENLSVMLDWVSQSVDEDLAFAHQSNNRIYWAAEESCASDHCSFFTKGFATFNFFSAGGDASFWQEWHSVSDNLDFMVAKAGGEDELAGGFNTLVWISLNLFIHVDNTGDEFQGRWVSE